MFEQYPQALSRLRDSIAQVLSFRGGHSLLAATLARMGHLEEARAMVAEALRLEPSYTISGVARRLVACKDPRDE